MTTARTILDQLGHSRFIAMTGARAICNLGNGLQFRFKGSARANSCQITLDPSDTYTVKFYKVRGLDVELRKEISGVHAEQLREIFEATTGLATSL